jgi:tetratricopeptide (TPR) repeat protein
MADAEENESSDASQTPAASGAAWDILGAASREKADTFLDEQIDVLRLQKAKLKKEHVAIDHEIALNLSHLRFRRLGDFSKFALETAAGLLVVGVLFALTAVCWDAANDRSLVIDAFTVPPDMAEKGLSGEVVASSLLDRLVAIQDETSSARAPDTYASNWGNDVKVEIPNTGISVNEAYRALVGWLGHQTHISGEVYHTTKGIAVVARVRGHAGARFEGRDTDLDQLVSRAAESIYQETQPYRYAVYVTDVRGEAARGEALMKELALNGAGADRPWALSVWGEDVSADDNMPLALALTHKAYELAPNIPLMAFNVVQMDATAAHDEDELAMARATVRTDAGSGALLVAPDSAVTLNLAGRETIEEELGDFLAAIADDQRLLEGPDYDNVHLAAFYIRPTNLVFVHDVTGSRKALGRGSDADMEVKSAIGFGWDLSNYFMPQFMVFAEEGEWKAARAHLEDLQRLPVIHALLSQASNRTQLYPWLALAEAQTGDMDKALALIGRSPLDCYLCLRLRGRIDGTKGNAAGADYWFARAVSAAPSIPFAYSEWGAELLREGQYDAAIEKFREANLKGPHFADPLEMWGEALMAKNRSDLALSKFEDADKYAPRWGRLHLKWGEALFYAGKKDEAQKRFAIAAGLDLSTADRTVLQNWMKAHG